MLLIIHTDAADDTDNGYGNGGDDYDENDAVVAAADDDHGNIDAQRCRLLVVHKYYEDGYGKNGYDDEDEDGDYAYG